MTVSQKQYELLEKLYAELNKKKYLSPDPLEVVYNYSRKTDREVVAFLAAGIAYGRVASILKSLRKLLDALTDRPASFLKDASPTEISHVCSGFKYRWTSAHEMEHVLLKLKALLLQHGSLENSFALGLEPRHTTTWPSLQKWTELLKEGWPEAHSMIPNPNSGSACKRLHMFLRWMGRSDGIDPGCWSVLPSRLLVVPLDVHMFRMCQALGFTKRNTADQAAALEITEKFRAICPDDPVRYDFALTRLGIHPDLTAKSFLDELKQISAL